MGLLDRYKQILVISKISEWYKTQRLYMMPRFETQSVAIADGLLRRITASCKWYLVHKMAADHCIFVSFWAICPNTYCINPHRVTVQPNTNRACTCTSECVSIVAAIYIYMYMRDRSMELERASNRIHFHPGTSIELNCEQATRWYTHLWCNDDGRVERNWRC